MYDKCAYSSPLSALPPFSLRLYQAQQEVPHLRYSCLSPRGLSVFSLRHLKAKYQISRASKSERITVHDVMI